MTKLPGNSSTVQSLSQQRVIIGQRTNPQASKFIALKVNKDSVLPLESPQKAEAMRTASSDLNLSQEFERLGGQVVDAGQARAGERCLPASFEALMAGKGSTNFVLGAAVHDQSHLEPADEVSTQDSQVSSSEDVGLSVADVGAADVGSQKLSVDHPEYPPFSPDDDGSSRSHDNPSARPKVSRMSAAQILAVFADKPEMPMDAGRFIGDVVDGVYKGAWLDETGALKKVGRYDEATKGFRGTLFCEKEQIIFGQTVDDKQMGKAQSYDKNGFLDIDGSYAAGVLQGEFEGWTGDLVYMGEAVHGRRHGEFLVGYHGEAYTMIFDNGKVTAFDDSGTSGLLRTQATLNLDVLGHPGAPRGLGLVMLTDALSQHADKFKDDSVFNALQDMLANDTKDLGFISPADIEQAVTKSKSKPVLLSGGTPNHLVGFVLYKNKLYIADRGDGAILKKVDPRTKEEVPYYESQAVKDQAIFKVRMPIVYDLKPDKVANIIKALQAISFDAENGNSRLKHLDQIDGVMLKRASNRRFDAPKYTKTLLRTGNCYYGNTHSALQVASELIRDKLVKNMVKQNYQPWQFRARAKAKSEFIANADRMFAATLKGDVQRKKALTQYIDIQNVSGCL